MLRTANRDGSVNSSEGRLLSTLYWLIRVGLIMIVFSGFGFFLYLRIQPHLSFVLYEPRMWMKLGLTALLVLNAFLMQVRRIPLWLGAAISVTGWYSALILGAWRSLDASFLILLVAFLAVLFPMIWLMRYLHQPVTPLKGKS